MTTQALGTASTPADVRAIQDNEAVFAHLLELGRARALDGRYQSALEWCRAAASFAMTNPTGHLRSEEIEQVADLVASRALAASPARPEHRAGRRRVLHVVSEARTIGGLTRMAERWIRRDTASSSSVVVTLQSEVVDALQTAVEASGGQAIALGIGATIDQAAQLRRLAEESDVVICHLHPADPVPAIAFGEGYHGAPVALFNHSDHLFWWAPTRAALVVDFRAVGTTLTLQGRGYAADAAHELPLLVPNPGAVTPKSAARERLGLWPDLTIALSVARAPKFRDTPLHPRFSEILATALTQNPSLAFCAVGPSAGDEPWPELLRRFPERIRVAGPVQDPHPYLDAGDIYLDTFPFSSLTSLLEASSASLPVLTLDAHQGLRRTLGIGDFVPTDSDRPRTLDAFLERLRHLVDSPDARRESGAKAQAAYCALTPDELWLAKMEELYLLLENRSRQGRSVGETAPPPSDDRLLDYSLAILAVEQRSPLVWMFGDGMPTFDARDRAEMRLRVLAARLLRKSAGWSVTGRRSANHVLLRPLPPRDASPSAGKPASSCVSPDDIPQVRRLASRQVDREG